MKNPALNENRSLQLSLLKLLSCIGVVYVHSCIKNWNFFVITPEKLSVVYYVQTVISDYIAQTAVPVFYAVSGYIYFAKQYQDSNRQFFLRKARGILWPYVLWNSIAVFYVFLAQTFILPPNNSPGYHPVSSFDLVRWVNAYIGWDHGWYPFLYTLWFLPVLFSAFMIVHIFRKYFYKYEWLIWLLALLNIICSSVMPLLACLLKCGQLSRLLSAVSFFTMGILFFKYQSIIRSKATLLISGTVAVTALVISVICPIKGVTLSSLFLYSELIFLFALTSHFDKCSDKIQKAVVFLSGFSFLIYVTHEFAMTTISQIVYPLIPAESWCILLLYLVMPVILISALIFGGWFLKKLLPQMYAFLFCGR